MNILKKIFKKVLAFVGIILVCGCLWLLNEEVKRISVQEEIKNIPPLETEYNLCVDAYIDRMPPNGNGIKDAMFRLRKKYRYEENPNYVFDDSEEEYESFCLNDFFEKYEIEDIIINNNYIPKKDHIYNESYDEKKDRNNIIDVRVYTLNYNHFGFTTVHVIVNEKETNKRYVKTFEKVGVGEVW